MSSDKRSNGRYETHDPKMISIFEVVGSYFVDTVFNHIYVSAKGKLNGGTSLTDESGWSRLTSSG